MDKFVYRFLPTFQFVLAAIMVVLLTWWIGFHLIAGHFGLIGFTVAGLVYFIVCLMAKGSWKEMRQAYKEEPNFPEFED